MLGNINFSLAFLIFVLSSMKNDSQYFTEMLASATIINNQQEGEKRITTWVVRKEMMHLSCCIQNDNKRCIRHRYQLGIKKLATTEIGYCCQDRKEPKP